MCDTEFKKGRFKLRIKLNHINVGVYVSFKVDSLPLEHILIKAIVSETITSCHDIQVKQLSQKNSKILDLIAQRNIKI